MFVGSAREPVHLRCTMCCGRVQMRGDAKQHSVFVLTDAPGCGELNTCQIRNADAITKNSACNLGQGLLYFIKYEFDSECGVVPTYMSYSATQSGIRQREVDRKEKFNIPAGTITPCEKKDGSKSYLARIRVHIGAAKSSHNCHLGQSWATPELASAALRTLCGQGYKKDEKFRTPSFESVDAMKIRAKQIRAGQR